MWELSETKTFIKPPEKQNNDGGGPAAAQTNAIVPPARPVAPSAATNAANAADDLPALRRAIAEFNHPLKQFAKNTALPRFVQGGGAGMLIITDAPSSDDDDSGGILTGAAGELMDKMLAAIGLTRDMASITPLVFWRAPGGRSPSREELDLAKPFVDRAISLLKPRAILTLGILTADEIANAKLPKNHGEQFECQGKIAVFPIYHPNYLILKPDAKKDAWAALQKLQKLLNNPQETL
jgi:DNA polymerase